MAAQYTTSEAEEVPVYQIQKRWMDPDENYNEELWVCTAESENLALIEGSYERVKDDPDFRMIRIVTIVTELKRKPPN